MPTNCILEILRTRKNPQIVSEITNKKNQEILKRYQKIVSLKSPGLEKVHKLSRKLLQNYLNPALKWVQNLPKNYHKITGKLPWKLPLLKKLPKNYLQYYHPANGRT